MYWRPISFIACLVLGGMAGAIAVAHWNFGAGSWVGVGIGALTWLAIDLYGASQLLSYLRSGGANDHGKLFGIWGESAGRMHRLIRDRDSQVAESQRRLQDFLSALQASPSGVILLDKTARIEWCNHTATQHFGLNAQRDVLQVIGNLVRDPGFAAYLASRDYKSSVNMPGRDSSPARPVVLSVQLHPYGEGRMLLLSRDITALEQAEAMRRDFVANVSHEIRTPLTVLAGFVETLQTLNLNEQERQHYLALMAQQSERMQSLVNDLLTLSRLEGSPPPGLETWVSVSKLMRQLKADAQALSQVVNVENGLVHKFVFNEAYACQITGVANELLSAMGNLVSNAVRYTPAGGRIDVSTQALPDGGLVFSVTDTGPGIAPEHIGRLTERFYRVDRSRSRETGGTGLGLAIVKHVVQRHGASLSIDSTPGHGSTFRITFPADRVTSDAQLD